MVRISTDDGRSINCKETLQVVMGKIEELKPHNGAYVWQTEPQIELTQVGGDFTEGDSGELSYSEWQKPVAVFVKHITRILEYGNN